MGALDEKDMSNAIHGLIEAVLGSVGDMISRSRCGACGLSYV